MITVILFEHILFPDLKGVSLGNPATIFASQVRAVT